MVETDVFVGDELAPCSQVRGPAIIEEPTTSLVVVPETTVTVSPEGGYIVDLKA